MFIGRKIAETMHGDSSHAIDLARIATPAGPPSVFTNLAGDGSIFNARNISSRNKTYRQVNNRLVPMVKVDCRSRREAVSSTLFPSSLHKSPQKPKHLFGLPATAAACDFEKGVQLSRQSLVEHSSLLQAVQNYIEDHAGKAPGKRAAMPACLDGINTVFFTEPPNAEQGKITPISNTVQGNPMKASGILDSLDDDDQKVTYVQHLVERALRRSFDDTGAAEIINIDNGKIERNNKAAMAIKRVNMITDDPGKVHRLTEMFVDRMHQSDVKVDSPAVNRMLDMFV